MTQYAIVTDLNRCVGCLACAVACKAINNVPVGNFWDKVLRVGPNPKSNYDSDSRAIETYYLPVTCQHCEDPECVNVCPTEASTKQADGTVQIDKAKCIGCQFCVMACPYGVRYLNQSEKVVEKCTLCEQRTSEGYLPQCVAQCGGRARYFGDIEQGIDQMRGPGDPTHETTVFTDYCKPYEAADVHALPDVGNHPSYRYILRGRSWKGDVG